MNRKPTHTTVWNVFDLPDMPVEPSPVNHIRTGSGFLSSAFITVVLLVIWACVR